MIRNSYRLPDKFTVSGTFWLPESPDEKVAGTLVYSTANIVLTLHGALSKTESPHRFGVQNDFERFSHVHGRIKNGYSCTLLNIVVTGHSFNSAQATSTSTTLSAIYLVIGAHTSGLADLRIQSVALQCSHLSAFLGRLPFDNRMPSGDEGFVISYNRSMPIRYRVDAITASLSLEMHCSMRSSHMKVGLFAESLIDFIPDTSQPIEWFLDNIWRFCELLTLLTDEKVRPLAMQVRLKSDNLYDGWLLYCSPAPYKEKSSNSPIVLFGLPHLGEEAFGSILEKWFGANRTLRNSFALFR